MIENKYFKFGRDINFNDRKLEIEEILFEGKWLLKLLNKYGDKKTLDEIFQLIEYKKIKNKKIRDLTLKSLS